MVANLINKYVNDLTFIDVKVKSFNFFFRLLKGRLEVDTQKDR